MYAKYILAFCLSFLLISCGSKKEDAAGSTPVSNAVQKPDNKALIAKLDSIIIKTAKAHKLDEKQFAGFHKFLQDLDAGSYSYTENITADLSGQGTTEQLTNTITFNGRGMLVESVIYEGKDPVYKSRLRLNPVFKQSSEFCESLEMFAALMPYSGLYQAYLTRVKVKDTPFGKKTPESAKQEFLTMKKSALEQLHLEPSAIAKQIDEYKAYLAAYKGKFISNLDVETPDTYFFDPKSKKFEMYSKF
jgi:hypothetical protein